jgi:hypothetical protein
MKTSQDAFLRCSSRLNATIPSRIVKADLQNYGRTGVVEITFDYSNKTYAYQVPFTRPYLNKSEGNFANLLNLNQHRNQNNLAFEEFIIRTTNNYQADPAIEIPCKISLVVQNDDSYYDDSVVETLTIDVSNSSNSKGFNLYEMLELDDNITHYILFADDRAGSFCTRKLLHFFSTQKVTDLLSTVNNAYECGNTFSTEDNVPFVTMIPIFNKNKGTKSEDDYLKSILADVIKSQNQYFKKPNICLVYSEFGFANKTLFVKEWNKAIKLLNFQGFSNFLKE